MEIEHNISEWRNLPTDINQLIQGENLILNTDYTGWSPDRIYKDILKKLGIVGSPGFTYVKPQKLTLYRVSDWFNDDDKREELARLASSFNLPPDHNTSLGRANLKGKSVFYASSQPFIAFDEKEMATNNIFWISVWELPLNKLNICEFIYDNQKGLFSIALEEFWKRVKESKASWGRGNS